MNEQDVKILNRAIKSAYKLHKNLEILDFELQKFNKFVQKIESFKTHIILLVAVLSFFLGFATSFILTYIKG